MKEVWFRALLVAFILTGLAGVPSAVAATPQPSAGDAQGGPWSFGIIADTQWTIKDAKGQYLDDGYNTNTAATNIIKQVDGQFIKAGVKLVVAVGDTIDWGSKANIDTRALYAQDLYNAGIGFYPLRGNHEASEDPNYKDSGTELRYAFPQIGTGVNNNTPAAIAVSGTITGSAVTIDPPAAKSGSVFTVGSQFSEPTAVNSANKSASYAFQYNNATFVLLDQFNGEGNYYTSTIPLQMQWISSTLVSRPANTHAFVFAHKNILGGNHKDNMFGGDIKPADAAAGKDPGDGNGMDASKLTAAERELLATKQTTENDLLAVLQATNVQYLITGHDHHHYLSVVTSPDGRSRVHQLIAASDSSKFYTPVAPVSANDTPIQQDLGRVGYYIVTVDGPRVTIDYYADTTGGGDYGLEGGTFHFVKMASTSYSLNGKDLVVAQGAPYSLLKDNTTLAATMGSGFKGTSMAILSGTNGSTTTTNYGKKISNEVTTGWSPAESSLASDVLSLGGMSRTLGSAKTDEYVLSMTYDPKSADASQITKGTFALVARDAKGQWVNAVAQNSALSNKFVLGAWNPSYKLGTYGVVTATNTAWAVLNYNGDFAVGQAPLPGRQ